MGLFSNVLRRRPPPGQSPVPQISAPQGPRLVDLGPNPVKAGFLRDGQQVVMRNIRPSLRSPADDVRAAWQDVSAQTNWFMQNSGFVAGMIDQAVANVVGTGLQLNSRPDAEALGMTPEQANEWARGVEARFTQWSSRPLDCDAEGRKNFGQLQGTAYRMWLGFGEIVASVPFIARPGATWRTKAKIIPAHMLVNTTDPFNNLIQGVRIDEYGYAKSFLFRKNNPENRLLPTGYALDTVEVAQRDSQGRAQVIHVFDGMAGQVRGISTFAPVLKVATQYDQLADATLTASILQSVFAAVMESDAPTIETLKALQTPEEQATGVPLLTTWLEGLAGWNQNVQIDLSANGRVAHLYPGQKLEFKQNEHPNSQYVDFASFLLREIARCAGMTYEQATGDYRGATYSSVRMAGTENYLLTLYRRKNIVQPFAQEIFEAWLEEDIEKGNTRFPGGVGAYNRQRAQAARAIWRGSGKPQADDLKTAKAHEVWARLGVMTHEQICAELGVDYEDVVIALAAEKKLREQHGVDAPGLDANVTAQLEAEPDDEPEPQDA